MTDIMYSRYFMPAGHKLMHCSREQPPSFPFCPPAVRLAALEAFVNLCVVQYVVLHQKIKSMELRRSSSGGTSMSPSHATSQPSSPSFSEDIFLFIPAAVEAVSAVVRFDPDRKVRRQAAAVLLEAIQKRPLGRHAHAALSLGRFPDPWNSKMWTGK